MAEVRCEGCVGPWGAAFCGLFGAGLATVVMLPDPRIALAVWVFGAITGITAEALIHSAAQEQQP